MLKVPADLNSGVWCRPVSRFINSTFSPCPHKIEGASCFSGAFFRKALTSFMRSPPSQPVHSQKPHPPSPFPQKLGYQCMNFASQKDTSMQTPAAGQPGLLWRRCLQGRGTPAALHTIPSGWALYLVPSTFNSHEEAEQSDGEAGAWGPAPCPWTPLLRILLTSSLKTDINCSQNRSFPEGIGTQIRMRQQDYPPGLLLRAFSNCVVSVRQENESLGAMASHFSKQSAIHF